MSRNRRLTFLGIAAAIAVVAVIVFVSGGSAENEPASTAPTSSAATPTATSEAGEAEGTAEPEETAEPEQTAEPKPEVPVLRAGKVVRLSFTEGDTVRFRVRSDVPEEVHVHGYDLAKDIEPGRPVSFSFEADITGIFEIEFEQSHEQIAQLRVDPR